MVPGMTSSRRRSRRRRTGASVPSAQRAGPGSRERHPLRGRRTSGGGDADRDAQQGQPKPPPTRAAQDEARRRKPGARLPLREGDRRNQERQRYQMEEISLASRWITDMAGSPATLRKRRIRPRGEHQTRGGHAAGALLRCRAQARGAASRRRRNHRARRVAFTADSLAGFASQARIAVPGVASGRARRRTAHGSPAMSQSAKRSLAGSCFPPNPAEARLRRSPASACWSWRRVPADRSARRAMGRGRTRPPAAPARCWPERPSPRKVARPLCRPMRRRAQRHRAVAHDGGHFTRLQVGRQPFCAQDRNHGLRRYGAWSRTG